MVVCVTGQDVLTAKPQLAGGALQASRELDRLQQLLGDAIPSLLHGFQKIAELAEAQGRLLDEVLAEVPGGTPGGEAGPGVAAAHAARRRRLAGTYRDHIRAQANGIIVALQFEDMARQLIVHLRERIESGAAGPGQVDPEIMRTYGPVSAENLKTGTVDLF